MEPHIEHSGDPSAANALLPTPIDLDVTMEDIKGLQDVDGGPKQRMRNGK